LKKYFFKQHTTDIRQKLTDIENNKTALLVMHIRKEVTVIISRSLTEL